ncbi:MAG: hypothetical protein AAF497_00380 [Planctomycetota bacterium]
MSQELMDATAELAETLSRVLADSGVRNSLRRFAQAILETVPPGDGEIETETRHELTSDLEPVEADADDPSATPSSDEHSVPSPAKIKSTALRAAEAAEAIKNSIKAEDAVKMLDLGGGAATMDKPSLPEAQAVDSLAQSNDELHFDETIMMVRERCLLKEEACNWASRRRQLLQSGADFRTQIQPNDEDIVHRARKIAGCYLWMSNSTCPEPDRPEAFDDLASGYGALAESIRVVREAERLRSQRDLEQACHLMAEAQSSLRQLVMMIGYEAPDTDQRDAFTWLRQFCDRCSILVSHHMRTNDPADFRKVDDLLERISGLDENLMRVSKKRRKTRNDLKKIKWEVNQYHQDESNRDQHLATIVRTIDELVNAGMKPSNVELREYLLSVLDPLEDKDELPDSVVSVLREIQKFLARNPASDRTTEKPQEKYSDEVRVVAGRLNNETVLLIGGDERPAKKRQIESAFGLKELIWNTTRAHSPLIVFESDVRKESVSVVLLAVRWASHSYLPSIKAICNELDKPLVVLPAGTNPNQIAHAIMEQAGDTLALGVAGS